MNVCLKAKLRLRAIGRVKPTYLKRVFKSLSKLQLKMKMCVFVILVKKITEKQNKFIIQQLLGLFLFKHHLESFRGHRLQVVKFYFLSIFRMGACSFVKKSPS